MDRALCQEDIVSCIIAQLDSRGALSTLARTSKFVSNLSLDALWRNIPSTVVLARCMPTEYWEEPEIMLPHKIYYSNKKQAPQNTFSSTIVLRSCERIGDWLGSRFRQYAARVRSINEHAEYCALRPQERRSNSRAQNRSQLLPNLTSSVGTDVLKAWERWSSINQESLFPNLASLIALARISADHTQDLDSGIGAFLVPSLTSLRLIDHSLETKTSTIIKLHIVHQALLRCPILVDINLGVLDDSAGDMTTLMNEPCQRLRVLCCERPSPEFIVYAATLPHLERFAPIGYPGHTLPHVPSAFSALRELHIRDHTTRQLCDLMDFVQSTAIYKLTLHDEHDSGTPEEINRLMKCLASHVSAHSFRELTITFNVINFGLTAVDQNTSHLPTSLDIIKPILELRHLRSVSIVAQSQFTMTEADFRWILQAWPCLQTLSIPLPGNTLSMPLQNFVESIQHHTLLESVPIEVICGLESPLPSLGGLQYRYLDGVSFSIIPGSQLDHSSDTTDRVPLAHYLATTFPRACRDVFRVRGDDEMRMLLEGAAEACRKTGTVWYLEDFNTCANSKAMHWLRYRRGQTRGKSCS